MKNDKVIVNKKGEKEPFDIEKLRKQIVPACEGTNISPLEFESILSLDLSHKVTTTEIQEALVLTAKDRISDEQPDWDKVAGRLMSHQVKGEVWKNTKIEMESFADHLKYLVRNGYYRSDLKNMISDDMLEKVSSYIKPERDYDLRLSQIALLKSKYLLFNQKGLVEYPSTADMTNAIILASVEEEDKKKSVIKEYYDMLSTYVLSLATPFKMNLRVPNGNTGSCFIGEFPDNTAGIFKSYSDMAFISQEGGGEGWYLGKIRPGDAYSPNVPKANVITKWAKIANDIAVAVNQRGIRKGAFTLGLDWWHLDVVDFSESKSELNGDLRDKCFDIFPQVIVDSYFMDAVAAETYVYQFDQYEFKNITGIDITTKIGDELVAVHEKAAQLIEAGKLKHFNKVYAPELWAKFMWVWIEYGDFYIAHKDNINLSNYMVEVGIAKCVNLCVESYSFSIEATKWKVEAQDGRQKTTESDGMYHSCNLISINVANILNNDKLLEKACRVAVRMLDASIDLGTMPVLEAKRSSEYIRNIGIGIVGMADWMAWNKVLYDSEEGKDKAEALTEKIAWYCYNASIDLAIEKGAYPGFTEANYDKLFGKTPEELNELSPNGFNWSEMQSRIKTNGIRNMLINAIAPNTSSGLVQGVTASYLPAHSKNNTQKLADLVIPVLPKFIDSRYWFYKTKFQYKTEDIIKFTRRIQRWIDTGISMELTINPELSPSIKSISDEIVDGFRSKELKAVYYSMTIDAKRETVCSDCAN